MKLAPLQLEGYCLTDLTFQANPDCNPTKETRFHEDDLAVAANVQPIRDQPRRWQVTLKLKLQPKPESNSPYFFSLALVGIVWAAPDLPQDKLDSIVRTNGPSMLFGAAREMVRDITARGPFPALALPSVSFLAEPTAPTTAPAQRAIQPEPAKC
jgi:preprotein translocase subunit SecB